MGKMPIGAPECSSTETSSSSQSVDLRSSSSSLESTPRVWEAHLPNLEKKVSWADCGSDSEQDVYDADGVEPDQDDGSTPAVSKSAKRRQRRKRSGQRGENAVSAVWAWDVSPQNAPSNCHDVKICSFSSNPHQRSVVTVSDLGLDIVMQPQTPSLPQRPTLSLEPTCHASLQVQHQFLPSGGMSQITTFPPSENWMAAVPAPICFGEHAPTSLSGAPSPLAVLSVSGVRSNEAQATEPQMTPVYGFDARIGVSAPR